MIAFPNAKINLGLNVVEKRDDGYHNLDSCFYPIPWRDSLEVIRANKFNFHSYGLPIPGDQESNLCIKAYELIKADHQIEPVEIHLIKSIPMGGGLGGGSSNAAFTLKLLNDLFKLDLDTNTLIGYALELGSDCPFFIENKPAIGKGRGELLSRIDLDLSGYYLALTNPGIHVKTQEAFDGIVPSEPENSIESIISNPMEIWKEQLKNDFETTIFKVHPQMKEIKKEMYAKGAIYASMTGTGSTVYGIFEKRPEIDGVRVFRL